MEVERKVLLSPNPWGLQTFLVRGSYTWGQEVHGVCVCIMLCEDRRCPIRQKAWKENGMWGEPRQVVVSQVEKESQ